MQACAETKRAGEAVPCRLPARVLFGLHVTVAAQRADGALAFDATDREVVANMEVKL
jgi:hypothetical protein